MINEFLQSLKKQHSGESFQKDIDAFILTENNKFAWERIFNYNAQSIMNINF